MDELDYGLIDRAGAASAMFYPRPDTSPPPAGASDQMIEVGPGVHVAARFYAASATQPTILYFHGNGEIAADHDALAPLYCGIGVNLFVAEFRGYGKSSGRPSMAALVGDGDAIAEAFHSHLDDQGFDARRFVMGRSLGSHPALDVAARHGARFAGLIIESGAAAIGRLLDRAGLAESADGRALAAAHDAKIRAIRLPTLIIHGEQDELVPLDRATELQTQLTSAGVELVVIPGAGHNDLLWYGQEQYFAAIGAHVKRTVAT